MIAFLNELSFENHNDWADALVFFWRVSCNLKGEVALFRDEEYFFSGSFAKGFNAIMGSLPPEKKGLIREMAFSDRYWQCWRPTRISNPQEDYHCEPPNSEFRDCSVCEGAERKNAQMEVSVAALNAADSVFGSCNRILTTRLCDGTSTEILGISNLTAWQYWVSTQRGHFDPVLGEVPRDFQTVLVKDPQRFRETGRVERRFRRKVFEEVSTGRLFYVDEGHPGHSAHLEVFDSRGRHLGVADIHSGDLDTSGRVDGRELRY